MPKRDSMYDDVGQGQQLKAEVRRASVMARKSMAAINERKALAKQQQSNPSLRGSEAETSPSLDRTVSGTLERQESISSNRGSKSDFEVLRTISQDEDGDGPPVVRYKSEMSTASWDLDPDADGGDKDPDASFWDHQSSISKKSTAPRMYSHDSDTDRSIKAARQKEHLSWLDMSKVEVVIIVLIILNMYCLALETDYPQWPWWNAINGAFLAVYIIEFGIRAVQKGPLFLLLHTRSGLKYWIWYDLIVIIFGVADIIVACQSGGSCRGAHQYVSSSGNRISMICADAALVRFLMLSRLLRALRILRMISDLYTFVKQLVSMITGTISWILLVIFLFCFVLAIIFTRLLGHGMLVSETETDSVTVKKMFKDVPSSLFALFQLTTADDWARIALPVISARSSAHPVAQFIWRLFFIFFITFMSWTMLSLLTAVASEEMMTLKSASKADEVLKQELERQGLINFLCNEFEEADIDENGVLDRQEFMDLMTQEHFRHEMKNHGLPLEERDIQKTWDTFDVDESGELTIEELVYGFSYLQEGLATKHVASIGYAMKRMQVGSERAFNDLEAEFDKINDVSEQALKNLDRQQYINKQQWNYFLSHQAAQAQEELQEMQDDMPSRTSSSPYMKTFSQTSEPTKKRIL